MAADWVHIELPPMPAGHLLRLETSFLLPESWHPRPTASVSTGFGVYPDGVPFPLPPCYPHWGEHQVYARKMGRWLQMWQVYYRDRPEVAFYMRDHVPATTATVHPQCNHVLVRFLYTPLKHAM